MYLTSTKYSVKHYASVAWCSFIWFLLKHNNVHKSYGDTILTVRMT